MKILVAEDDFASRKFMAKYLQKYGDCDITVDGEEAVDAFLMATEDEEPYDLVCLDVMMPVLDGYQALKAIRDIEKERGIMGDQAVKIIMTTALNEEKNVKKARSHGLSCIVENTGEYLDDFLRIYNGTMERTEAEGEYFFSRQFFEELNEMKDNVMYFHVFYEGKIISTELVIYGAENAYSYLGGTDSAYFGVRPNDYLKYEIIKWGCEKKLKNFILGGGHGTDDGIFQYKAALAPNGIYDFYVGTDIFCEEKYQKLCDIRKMEDPYFNESEKLCPAYRF